MQLSRFSDLGLRVLMDLTALAPGASTTIAQVCERFDVPHNHLSKVVQFMAQQGWLHTVRGKGGGLSLAWPPERYRLGQVIRTLERDAELIDCAEPPCVLRGRCALKGLLDEATQAFYDALDRHSLADAVASPTGPLIVRLHRQARAG